MTIKYHNDFEQGSEDWFAARCGLLTASEMKLIITPKTLAYAQNDKERCHLYELLAQRINKYVEPHYIGDEMLRGHADEVRAKIAYNEKYEAVTECGFITNDFYGFTLGYSPDALVGEYGLIECKSRRQKYQVETIISNSVPTEHLIQTQTGLLVSERRWCDYISYCGGMPMFVLRVYPDEKIGEAILNCAGEFEKRLAAKLKEYNERLADPTARFTPTERVIEQEMSI